MDWQTLGNTLRDTRTAKELTLDDAVSQLRIRRPILEAFENGEFSRVGSPVQVRGLLRNYALFLGLDEEVIIQQYNEALEGGKRRWGKRKDPTLSSRPSDVTFPAMTLGDQRANRRSWFSNFLGSLMISLVSLAAIAVIIFVVWNILTSQFADIQPTTTPPNAFIAEGLNPTATYTASWTPAGDLLLSPTPFLPDGSDGLRVTFIFEQRSWALISVDGVETFEGVITPQEQKDFVAVESVQIRAANAAAFKVNYNGLEEGNFGARGQAIELRISARGIEILSTSTVSTPTLANVAPAALPSDVTPTATIELGFQPNPNLPTPTPLFPIGTPIPTQEVATGQDVTVADTTNNSEVLPSPTPFLPFEPSATATIASTATLPPSNTPTNPPPTATATFTATATTAPTLVIPTMTWTPTPTQPAETSTPVLPLRITQTGLPPTKAGGQ